jgi:CobQ-like glutamine amidotransferase family enzyme
VTADSTIAIGLIYPELMGTYGDRGNATVLERRLAWRHLPARVVVVPAGAPIPGSIDCYVLGGAEDVPQTLAAEGLIASLPAIERALEGGAVLLANCAGFQLLGSSYVRPDGASVPGLGLIDATTVAGARRCIGEVAVETGRPGFPELSGFENHAGITRLGPGVRPLGRVTVGTGNGDGRDGPARAGVGPEPGARRPAAHLGGRRPPAARPGGRRRPPGGGAPGGAPGRRRRRGAGPPAPPPGPARLSGAAPCGNGGRSSGVADTVLRYIEQRRASRYRAGSGPALTLGGAMAEETSFGEELKETRLGHGGGSRNHGLPLGEATPELRRQWKGELEKSGKYNPGASLKELIAKRDGQEQAEAAEDSD